MRRLLFLGMAIFLYATAIFSAEPWETVVNSHLRFDDFGFLKEDFVARSGLKTPEERGMTIENGDRKSVV